MHDESISSPQSLDLKVLPWQDWPQAPAPPPADWPTLPPLANPEAVTPSEREQIAHQQIASSDPLVHADMVDTPAEMGLDSGGHESPELSPWPLLAPLLRISRDELLEPNRERFDVPRSYLEWDREATRSQLFHSKLVLWAGICALGAVVLAIFQLGLHESPAAPEGEPPVSHQRWDTVENLMMSAEIVMAVGAAVGISLGVWASLLHMWRLRRLQAEQCRIAKFGWLLNSENHLQDMAAAKLELHTMATKIEDLDPGANTAQATPAQDSSGKSEMDPREVPLQWIRRLAAGVETPQLAGTEPTAEVVDQLVDYMLKKRLRYQANYFKRQHDRRHSIESSLWKVPIALFVASLGCAIAHCILDAFSDKQIDSSILLWGAACLPAFAAFYRVIRGAHEYARNSNRFYAMWVELFRLERDLLRCREQGDLRGQLQLLREVELALQSEHRSWMRLMIETEWFG